MGLEKKLQLEEKDIEDCGKKVLNKAKDKCGYKTVIIMKGSLKIIYLMDSAILHADLMIKRSSSLEMY